MVEAYIGEIRTFAGNYAPPGWAVCNGQEFSIRQYQGLYSIIGNTYGGTPGVSFNVPDLVGRVPRGAGYGKNLTQVPFGKPGGAESTKISGFAYGQATLNEKHIPPHSHKATFTGVPSSTTFTSTLDVATTYGGPTPIAGGLLAQASTTGTGAASIFVAPGGSAPTVAVGGGKGSVSITPTGDVTIDDKGHAAVPFMVTSRIEAEPTNLINPFLGLTYIIALDGNYPHKS